MPTYRNLEQTIYAGDCALYKDKKRKLSYLMPVKVQRIQYCADGRIEIYFTDLQISYVADYTDDLELYYFESEEADLKLFYTDYLAHLKRIADKEDDVEACFSYASLSQFWSYQGSPKPVDAMQQAVMYFAKASEAGHGQASHTLADMYRKIINPLYQICFEPNRQKSLQYYLEKSAEQGNPIGQYQLAYFNEYAEHGFTQNYEKAVYWYQQSADQNYPQALNNLADKYEKAKGVKRDYQKAAQYYQRSADLGIKEAMYNLGRLYLRGLGVEKDLTKGRFWLEKSAQKYYQPAIRKLRDLDKN